jgi:2-methylcitrate dehydratase PrpD
MTNVPVAADESPVDDLAEYLITATMRELPPPVVEKTVLHIIDSVAAAVSGMRLEAGLHARSYVAGIGGPGPATVFGTDIQTSIPYAALANGMAAHGDETDDSLPPLGSIRTHPGCSIVPSAIATAEANGRSGTELIRAVALGYDYCSRFAMALWSTHRAAILEKSSVAVANVFGASAAAASLLGFDAEQAKYVFSYAVQHASGLNTFFRGGGHVEKAYVFSGMPSFNATSIALMVNAGWTGVEDVFVDSPSFFSLGPCPDPARLTAGLGVEFEVMRTRFKKYPVGSPIQSPLEGLLQILRDERLSSDDVARVEVRLSPPRYQVCHDRRMSSINIEYLIEVALVDGELTFGNAHDEPRFQAWRASGPDPRIAIRPDAAFGDGHGASVEISTNAGRTVSRTIPIFPGSVENPMTPEHIEEKASGLLVPILGERRAAGLLRDLGRLAELDDVRALRQWLSVA